MTAFDDRALKEQAEDLYRRSRQSECGLHPVCGSMRDCADAVKVARSEFSDCGSFLTLYGPSITNRPTELVRFEIITDATTERATLGRMSVRSMLLADAREEQLRRLIREMTSEEQDALVTSLRSRKKDEQ